MKKTVNIESRAQRMLNAALKTGGLPKNGNPTYPKTKQKEPMELGLQESTFWPSYESTECSTADERQAAIEGWKIYFPERKAENPLPVFESVVSYGGCPDEPAGNTSSESKLPVDQHWIETSDGLHSASDEASSLIGYDSDRDPDYVISSDENVEDDDEMFESQISLNDHDSNETFLGESHIIPEVPINSSFESEKSFDNRNTDSDQQKSHESERSLIRNDMDTADNTTSIQGDRTKRVRGKDFCFYCETLVTTFARHIMRNHRSEIEIQKINSLKIKSQERKNAIAAIRKKGNYLFSTIGTMKPVRKPVLQASEKSLLPCTYCLGFYSKKQLWRHRKKCSQNPGNKEKESSQVAGQNFLLKEIKHHSKLREIVFPRMRADMIAFTAKKDPLICAYGSRFLLTHREKHQINVASRKMRELGKLLMEIKKIQPKISNLLQALKPENFDVLVEAAKIAASYDAESDRFNAPTYAMNISTSLKECCEIGISHALKKKHCSGEMNAAEAEAELRTTILLLKSNWKYEISHQAANNLYSNKMNKITIVPLASDLKLFRDYLIKKGNDAVLKLEVNPHDSPAFKILTETVYCRVLLLCRKRVGELQRLPLELYQNTSTSNSYEEFKHVVKPIEMMLIRKFKRVVIQGKRKATPVLFSFDVQKQIELLIALRNNFVPCDNTYLFANMNSSNPILGYKVLKKHSEMANLKNPEAVTSRCLRKHLATISQLFQMTDTDIEQLASFMGHTYSTHRQEYRLPDDVFQTARVAKVLLTLENEGAVKNKGRPLDQIEVDLEDNLFQTATESPEKEDTDEEELLNLQDLTTGTSDRNTAVSKSSNKTYEISAPKKREFTKWSAEEKSMVYEHFKSHIQQKKPAKKHECETLMNQNPTMFKDKTWLKMKVLVQNYYTNKAKPSSL